MRRDDLIRIRHMVESAREALSRNMAQKIEVKQRISKSVRGKVKARKCKHCGHHEVGIVTKAGKFIALKPGDKITLVED